MAYRTGDAVTYVLTAVRFRHNVAYNEKGQPTEVHIYRQGDVVDDLPPDHLERLLTAGDIAISQPDEDDADDAVDDSDAPNVDTDADLVPADAATDSAQSAERPRNTATKKAWVDYAVTKGWTREDADALDRAELIEKLG